eukprot:3590736-Amphidinium_carterae.1
MTELTSAVHCPVTLGPRKLASDHYEPLSACASSSCHKSERLFTLPDALGQEEVTVAKPQCLEFLAGWLTVSYLTLRGVQRPALSILLIASRKSEILKSL